MGRSDRIPGPQKERSLKSDATPRQKKPVMKKAAKNPVRDVNKMQPKQLRALSDVPAGHSAKNTKFSGSTSKYSREFIGKSGRNGYCDPEKGLGKFRRDFDASGAIGKAATASKIKMSAQFFPSRERPYTAGFHHHPDSAKIAA